MTIKDRNIERILWTGFIITILAILIGAKCFGQGFTPTFQKVRLDSIAGRSDTIWITNETGSTSYLFTRNDTLFLNDAGGEKPVAGLTIGGSPYARDSVYDYEVDSGLIRRVFFESVDINVDPYYLNFDLGTSSAIYMSKNYFEALLQGGSTWKSLILDGEYADPILLKNVADVSGFYVATKIDTNYFKIDAYDGASVKNVFHIDYDTTRINNIAKFLETLWITNDGALYYSEDDGLYLRNMNTNNSVVLGDAGLGLSVVAADNEINLDAQTFIEYESSIDHLFTINSDSILKLNDDSVIFYRNAQTPFDWTLYGYNCGYLTFDRNQTIETYRNVLLRTYNSSNGAQLLLIDDTGGGKEASLYVLNSGSKQNGIYIDKNKVRIGSAYSTGMIDISNKGTRFYNLETDTSNYKAIFVTNDSIEKSVNVYAGMYLDSNTVATTINTQDVWENIGNMTQGSVFENATYTQDTIWIDYSGIYEIGAFVSTFIIGISDDDYEIGVSVNGELPLIESRGRSYIKDTWGNLAGSPFLYRLNDGDYLTMKIVNRTGTDNVSLLYGGLTIKKLN